MLLGDNVMTSVYVSFDESIPERTADIFKELGQVSGVYVFNTFAPVVKSITVRLLLALAFIFNMHIHRLGVSNAFSYAYIEGDEYMQPIPDFQLTLATASNSRSRCMG